VTFLRQIALLLPSAFLLGALSFLLTHGRDDAGFGTYPFFEQWIGPRITGWTPEQRFLAQAGLFFVPAYVFALLLVFGITLAERALFGRPAGWSGSAYRRSFAAAFSVLFLLASGALVLLGEWIVARRAPGTLLAPLIVALAPFGAGAAALLPAAALAVPLAALRKAGEA
jgi:hypothetical protein